MTELDRELALDRIAGELARDMPAHVRAFARAYVAGRPAPAPPDVLTRASTIALRHPLAVPLAIERDPRVRALRDGERTWARYAELHAARDAASRRLFGRDHRDILHEIMGTDPDSTGVPSTPDTGSVPMSDVAIEPVALDALLARAGVSPIVIRADVRPRAFIVSRDEVIVVIPATIATRAARFAVLHELGHAVAAKREGLDLPRARDEAWASLVARLDETDHDRAARARRRYIAARLDAIEREPHLGPAFAARPPWALVHDPQAQAAYVAAEAIADHLSFRASVPSGNVR